MTSRCFTLAPGTIFLTTDAMSGGIDFFANDPPDTIAKKAAGNLWTLP
jgi:hypothetical protein